jgi:hypothetical protein
MTHGNYVLKCFCFSCKNLTPALHHHVRMVELVLKLVTPILVIVELVGLERIVEVSTR